MVQPHPGLLHLHAPSQLESGRAAFKDQDQNRALCPIPRNHFLTDSVQVYSCLQWEDKPELEVGTHKGLAVQLRISSCPGLEETQTEGTTPFYPRSPKPGPALAGCATFLPQTFSSCPPRIPQWKYSVCAQCSADAVNVLPLSEQGLTQ